MKVLFLDIDGVLNYADHFDQFSIGGALGGLVIIENDRDRLNNICIQNVNAVLASTGAKVVLSTDWVHNRSVAQIKSALEDVGFEGDIIGVTVRKISPIRRVDEISMWLSSDEGKATESFVILEDDHPMYHFEYRTVRTVWEEGGRGFTVGDISKATAILNHPLAEDSEWLQLIKENA